MKKLSFVGWFLAASSVVLALGSCQEEQLPATISGLPDGDITFLWNDTGSKTVSIESNYDWTFEEEDEHDIIEVTRTQGTNDLVIKPDINYDRKAYTQLRPQGIYRLHQDYGRFRFCCGREGHHGVSGREFGYLPEFPRCRSCRTGQSYHYVRVQT